jgi:hypothetical protein
LALLVVAVGGLSLGLGRLGGDAVAAARAQTAADAAALAGAAAGEEAARRMAAANGGELLVFTPDGTDVEVRARVGGAEAVARARRSGGLGGSTGGVGGAVGLAPEMRAALARAEAALGTPVPVVSGWRSSAAQSALYANRGSNPYPVARPGTSAHERGTAVDVPRAFVPRLVAVGPAVGLCQPLPESDPIHFELCR